MSVKGGERLIPCPFANKGSFWKSLYFFGGVPILYFGLDPIECKSSQDPLKGLEGSHDTPMTLLVTVVVLTTNVLTIDLTYWRPDYWHLDYWRLDNLRLDYWCLDCWCLDYWPLNYWPLNYWHLDYWPLDYWCVDYWHLVYLIFYLTTVSFTDWETTELPD